MKNKLVLVLGFLVLVGCSSGAKATALPTEVTQLTYIAVLGDNGFHRYQAAEPCNAPCKAYLNDDVNVEADLYDLGLYDSGSGNVGFVFGAGEAADAGEQGEMIVTVLKEVYGTNDIAVWFTKATVEILKSSTTGVRSTTIDGHVIALKISWSADDTYLIFNLAIMD